ncbi:hypothetical protein FCV25MIE_03198 [Fagus crenata]
MMPSTAKALRHLLCRPPPLHLLLGFRPDRPCTFAWGFAQTASAPPPGVLPRPPPPCEIHACVSSVF